MSISDPGSEGGWQNDISSARAKACRKARSRSENETEPGTQMGAAG